MKSKTGIFLVNLGSPDSYEPADVKEYLDYKAIARLADEADELGYFEFDLQGGELLLQPKKLFKED